MGKSNEKKQNEGAWIFVSHSHKDLEKVKFIRNEFEKRGHFCPAQPIPKILGE